MNSSTNTERTPCLVETQQGVSIEYQNKFLYSKYNPAKNIETLIEKIQILPGTIFLCYSPVLDYGVDKLITKLPDNCLLFLCEKDNLLKTFINDYYQSKYIENEKIFFPNEYELCDLPIIFNKKQFIFSDNKIFKSGYYKRVIRIDFSAGIQFNLPFYNQLEILCVKSIKTFWINRVTLTKFGRKYSRNLFQNIGILSKTTPIKNFIKNVSKPIIICGAGESLNKGYLDFIQNRDSFFIIAVDTAANFLIKNKIIPDAIFIEETQNIILKSFFEINKYKNCQIFAGLSSLSNLSHYINDNSQISYFFTKFSDSNFLYKLQEYDFFPPENPAFGSVGLTATYYALRFRQDDSIPIYIYGLDFAYTTGITHVKNSLSSKDRLIKNNKINKIANYPSTFINSEKINQNVYTTYTLKNYSEIFKAYFSNSKNLFDSRNFGIFLDMPESKPSVTTQIIKPIDYKAPFKRKINEDLSKYFVNEISYLRKLKSIFTNSNPDVIYKSQEEIDLIISDILKDREYLYLHFIDGYQLNLNKDFLNRIRIEIDNYIKEFELILNLIN